MFLVDWFYRVLSSLGLYGRRGKLLLLGLDNAGKTSLLFMIKEGRMSSHAPTQRTTMEKMTLDFITFECFDLGGHREAREIWTDYFVDASAIIYMVDATDRARFPESKRELDSLLTNPQLAQVPVVVLGNKIDLPSAASEGELRAALGLVQTTGKTITPKQLGPIRPIEVFMCSVRGRTGYVEGIRWIAGQFD